MTSQRPAGRETATGSHAGPSFIEVARGGSVSPGCAECELLRAIRKAQPRAKVAQRTPSVGVIRFVNHQTESLFGYDRDVTKQREAFAAARGMIESSLDSLVWISPEGRITDVNEATVLVTGVAREQLIGTAFLDYFTEPEQADRIYRRVFKQGLAVDYPLTMRHVDGTGTDVRYNASVYHDADGKVLGVFAAARDVTQQVHAQRQVAETQARHARRRTVTRPARHPTQNFPTDENINIPCWTACRVLPQLHSL